MTLRGIRYVTLTDERFFIGTVALVNSLRLTENGHDILIVDAGLRSDQRDRLAAVADVRRLENCGSQVLPPFLKPRALMSAPMGTLVFLDSDMIVTASLESTAIAAAEGRICVLPDGPPRHHTRRFEDAWTKRLHLRRPLREQPYINSGFIALDSSRWVGLLERWIELCAEVSESRSLLPHSIPMHEADVHPFAYLDQDVLNAILMSEVDESAVVIGDWHRAGVPEPEDTTRIVERLSLQCQSDRATSTMLLHHFSRPKPWFAEARGCLMYEPYDELLVRLLTGPDLTIVLPPDAIPVWLRRGPVRRIERRVTRSQTMPARVLRRAHTVAFRQTTRARLTREESSLKRQSFS